MNRRRPAAAGQGSLEGQEAGAKKRGFFLTERRFLLVLGLAGQQEGLRFTLARLFSRYGWGYLGVNG